MRHSIPAVSAPLESLVSTTEFESGRPYTHVDGSNTRFADDKWVLQVKAGFDGRVSANFSDLPECMRLYAKRIVAHDWLAVGKKAGSISAFLTGLRTGLRAMPDFDGPTLENLTANHVSQVHDWLKDRHQAGLTAIAGAEKAKGSRLAPREARAVLKSVGGIKYPSIVSTVRSLNRVLQSARDSGAKIDVRFSQPQGVRKPRRRTGGADPGKVLSPHELAALIRATQADIDEYLSDRAILDDLDQAIGHGVVTPELPHRSWLMRYLGAGGKEPESLRDIAADAGVAPIRGARLLPWLARSVGESCAEELFRLRDTMRHRGPKASPEERQRARDELRDRVRAIDFDAVDELRHFEEPLARFFGLRGHRVHSASEAAAIAGKEAAEVYGYLMRKQILNASVDKELSDAARAARNRALNTHRRAIKACALQLLATTSRRVSAFLLSLPAKPEMSWVEHAGERLFYIQFRAFKIWGDEGLPERVEIPGYLGEIAEKAIRTAIRLTESLRSEARLDVADCLFIYHNANGPNGGVRALTSAVLFAYLHSSRGDGLLVRRNVPRANEISTHWFRHTAGQAISSSTGQPVFAAKFLGNTPEQAATAYCSMGTKEIRQQAAAFIEEGRASGAIFDAIVRLKMAADGNGEDEAPASQLSIEEAIERVQSNPNFLWDVIQGDEEVSPELASEYLKRGIVVNLTARGGCILPASEGPCPASDECPIGCDPEANERDPGCGCRWQVLIPHDEAFATLTSDLEALRQQVAEVTNRPEYGAWASHLRTRIGIWEAQLARLNELRGTTEP